MTGIRSFLPVGGIADQREAAKAAEGYAVAMAKTMPASVAAAKVNHKALAEMNFNLVFLVANRAEQLEKRLAEAEAELARLRREMEADR